MRLVIVCCGQSKIWDRHPDAGPTKAKDVYTGPYFSANRRYAEHLECDWMVFSAKYGLVQPDFVIPHTYNVTFKDPSTHPISIDDLRRQLFEQQLGRYDIVTVLGGRDYIRRVEEAFAGIDARFETPFAGGRMGEQMAAINGILSREAASQTSGSTFGERVEPARPHAAVARASGASGLKADVFRRALNELFASSKGEYVDVTAGDLHRNVGVYPDRHHDMPGCSDVMRQAMRPGDTVLAAPPKGRGASLTIRYRLPR